MSRKLYDTAINESSTRTRVVVDSAYYELMMSRLLCAQMDIDIETSNSFNKGGALSFDSKVRLLLDMKSITPDDKSKLKLFMEIRNKFAHVLQVISFENCFDAFHKDEGNKGRENQLKKLYPNFEITGNREADFSGYYDLLCTDIDSCIERVLEYYVKQKMEDGKLAVNAYFGNKYMSITNSDPVFNDLFKNKIMSLSSMYTEEEAEAISAILKFVLIEYADPKEALNELSKSSVQIHKHFPPSKTQG